MQEGIVGGRTLPTISRIQTLERRRSSESVVHSQCDATDKVVKFNTRVLPELVFHI